MALIGSMSGSLTHLTDGTSYLLAGNNVTIVSGSTDEPNITLSATPAGSNTQFQFNNSDAFGGSDNLTFDGTNITVGGADADAKLLFRDSAIFLQSSADGQLDIDADGEIEMASAKLDVDMSSDFNISGGAESTITTTAGALNLTADANDSAVVIKGDHESGTAIHLDGNAATASVVDIDAGHLDIDASDKVTIDAADEIELTTSTADGHITLHSAHTSGVAILIDANADAAAVLDVDAGKVDIDAQGTFEVDATGISLDSDAASNFSTSGGAITIDGQTGVNIQEDGTTVISVSDSRSILLGTTPGSGDTPGTDVALFLSGAQGDENRIVVTGDFVLSGNLAGGYDSESAGTHLQANSRQIEFSNQDGYDNELTEYGDDVFFFVSGALGETGQSGRHSITLLGGDAFVSGVLSVGGADIGAMGGGGTISGSIHHTTGGLSYLVGGSNVTITSASNGQVTIAASGGGGSIGGSNTQVQFNDGGSFQGDSGLVFNKTSDTLTATNVVVSETLVGGGSTQPLLVTRGSEDVSSVFGTDTVLFISGAATPIGGGDLAFAKRRRSAVFAGDIVASGTIRGGHFAAANITLLGLQAGLTTIAAGTVPATSTAGGPGVDVSLFVSGSTSATNHVAKALFGGQVVSSGSILPGLDNTIDLGASTQRWANIYTGDLHLKNDRGDWTMIEEKDYLSLRNNVNGKLYRLLMEEVTE